MAIAQNRIIHRFIRDFSDYDENGVYYGQIIPIDTQAFAIYPEDSETPGVYYVLGDGIHTYLEIKRGLGDTKASKEYPMFTKADLTALMNKADKSYVDTLIENVKTLIGDIVVDLTSFDERLLQVEDDIEILKGAVLKFENVPVDPSSFVADTTYETYPFKANIDLDGVTKSMFSIVVFNVDDAIEGNYCFVVETYNGGVSIWCREAPKKQLIIPTIICQ